MTQKLNTALQFEFSCPLSSGLHARPASQLAELANRFAAQCTLTNLRNGLVASAGSVLGVIAADVRHGDRCTVQVIGPDEHAAYAALQHFVEEVLPGCEVPLVATVPSARKQNPPRALPAAVGNCIFGVPVSRGIGQGKVVILRRITFPEKVPARTASDPHRELARIKEAVDAVRHRIREKLKHSLSATGTAVLQADLAIAGDVFLAQKLTEQVRAGKSAPEAIIEAGEFFINLLAHSENQYIRERSADIEEVCVQLLEEVSGDGASPAPIELNEPSVLVGETLAPQQLLQLDRRWLQGLLLEHSGTTSHAIILARSLGIPTLVGMRNARAVLTPGSEVVVDASRGFAVPALLPGVQRFYEVERRTLRRRQETWERQIKKASLTADGRRLEVAANASSSEEVSLAFENGADGIGLFRTEVIYLGRDEAPSEDEQYAIYSQAARGAGNRPVILRTFDIGGDKEVPYLNLVRELNPFLGYRGARMYADHHELLQTQLCAMLRASVAGNIQIMAPMISSVEEFVGFKASVELAKQQLSRSDIPFRSDVKIGVMVEVPSVAFALDQFCTEVDFFSIGTNDLSQYFFASDRSNPRTGSLFSVHHPAFLGFLKQLVFQIRRAGKWVGMCGEMAADLRIFPLLLGLELDEISVPAAEVHEFKRSVGRYSGADCVALMDRSISCRTTGEVEQLLAAQPFRQTESLLSDNLVLLESTSQTKEEVIHEMVDALYVSGRTDDRQQLEEALWARETGGSTGFGHGFAIPHCKTAAITADSICILRLKEPIGWDVVDREQVSMVVLLALRESESANTTHMQVFSTLARKLINDDFREHLIGVSTADEVTAYLAAQLGISR
jgi:phosphoenolpyruvate-protein phosphotransferase